MNILSNFDEIAQHPGTTIVFMLSQADVHSLLFNTDISYLSKQPGARMFYTIYGDVPEITQEFRDTSFPGTIVFRDGQKIQKESKILTIAQLKKLLAGGLIDKNAELQRLDNEIEKIRKNLEKSLKNLETPGFVERAPADVVEKEKTRVADMQAATAKLQAQRDKIAGL
jgi:valyl-tRNA synthetase